MRTTITVGQLTQGQLEWLVDNLRNSYDIAPNQLRMCVTFEGADGEPARHVEMPAGEWIRVMNRLHRIALVAEALLTPDSAMSVMWGAVPSERYEAELKGWSGL